MHLRDTVDDVDEQPRLKAEDLEILQDETREILSRMAIFGGGHNGGSGALAL